jgi:hypothetical protein
VVDTDVVVVVVTGLVVWVVVGTEVVGTAVVAGTAVWVGDVVWVVFAAHTGITTRAAQDNNTRSRVITDPWE